MTALLVFALACGGDGVVDSGGGPEAIQKVSGDLQTDTVGLGLQAPAVVKVVDGNGEPVGGVSVNWSVESGGGSLNPEISTTNAAGETSSQWTLGTTAGQQTATASASGVPSVSFSATALPDRPAVVTPGSDTTRLTALQDTAQLTVAVSDQYGNPIVAPTVAWSSSDTTVAKVNASGRVWSEAEGEAEITASVDTATGRVVVVVQQAVASLAMTPITVVLTAAGDTIRMRATATDANGHPVIDPPLVWSTSAGAVADVDGTGLVTANADGTATIRVESGPAGDSVDVEVRTATGVMRQWVGGDAAGPTAWQNPANWLPAGAPNGRDTASVPGTATDLPVLAADAELLRLVVESGASLTLGGHSLTAHGDVEATGAVTGQGALIMDGTGTLAGTVPRLRIAGTVALADTTSAAWATLDGGLLHFNGFPLLIRP